MQQSPRIVAGILAALVAVPSVLAGQLYRTGNSTLALELIPMICVVILLSAAIMQQRKEP